MGFFKKKITLIMPSHRKGSKVQFKHPSVPHSTEECSTKVRSSSGDSESSIGILKHVSIPDIPVDSDILFEITLWFYSMMVLGLQYLNLYKTVWWLPHSHAVYAMNFYLIDPYLVLAIGILIGRRVPWSITKELFRFCRPRSLRHWVYQLLKMIIISSQVTSLGWCLYHILLRHSMVYILYLCYPVIVYIIMFGPNLSPLVDTSTMLETRSEKSKKSSKNCGLQLQHACSQSGDVIREEVECLKTDFNHRVKQVLFNSLICAYYAGFIPCCFAQSILHYDVWWVCFHVFLVWISSVIMLLVHYFPPRYSDTLHRSALHLGKWQKLEGRNHIPCNLWTDASVWMQGSVVKHMREVFKAEGLINAAEPGNSTHQRFYSLFKNPMGLLYSLLILEVSVVVFQLGLLFRCSEWNQNITLALILMFNYYILFKVLRAYIVLYRVYRMQTT